MQQTTVTALPSNDGQDTYAMFAIQDLTDLTRQVQDYRHMRDQALAEARERSERQAQAQREAELKARLAAEDESRAKAGAAAAAQRAAALQRDAYGQRVKERIEQNWVRPPSARAGLDCTLRVTQVPGGEVTGAVVSSCNGDEAVRESIVAAVLRASPLPPPPAPELFERNLVIRFVPDD